MIKSVTTWNIIFKMSVTTWHVIMMKKWLPDMQLDKKCGYIKWHYDKQRDYLTCHHDKGCRQPVMVKNHSLRTDIGQIEANRRRGIHV